MYALERFQPAKFPVPNSHSLKPGSGCGNWGNGNSLKHLEDVCLQAKARIWPYREGERGRDLIGEFAVEVGDDARAHQVPLERRLLVHPVVGRRPA